MVYQPSAWALWQSAPVNEIHYLRQARLISNLVVCRQSEAEMLAAYCKQAMQLLLQLLQAHTS